MEQKHPGYEAEGRAAVALHSFPIVSVTKPLRPGQNWFCALTCTLTMGQGTHDAVRECWEGGGALLAWAATTSLDAGDDIDGVWIPDRKASDLASIPPRVNGEGGGEEML